MVVIEFRLRGNFDEPAQKALCQEILETGVHVTAAVIDVDGGVRLELQGDDWHRAEFIMLRTWLSARGASDVTVGIVPDGLGAA